MRAPLVLAAALAAAISSVAAGGTNCPADVDDDGIVGVDDFLLVLSDWGCVGTCAGDANGDSFVNVDDFLQVLAEWGCQVTGGPEASLSGTVTNAVSGAPIEGATVHVGDDVLMTNAAGDYSGMFAVGLYDVTIEADYFDPFTQGIVLFPDIPATLDAALDPITDVIVNVIVPGGSGPGDVIDVMAEVIVLDGSTIQSFAWAQTAGTPLAAISGEDTDTVTVTLGSLGNYKEELFALLAEPPIGPDDLPPNVPPPPGEFPGGLQERWEVAATNFLALDEAGLITLAVDVTTTSGTYSAEGEVLAGLPWEVPAAGIRNVPIDVPVLLNGKVQPSYDWVLAPPNGSASTLHDPGTRHPDFTPDIPGLYELMVTDTTGASAGVLTLQVWAGNWRGVIVGQEPDGRQMADPDCTGCHSDLGFDKFTPWSATGHAHIFTDLLDTNTHNSENCFTCHSVGFNKNADNNGLDDAFDYPDFLASGLINQPGDNWTTMLADFPDAAQLSNVQCENCHGPQWGLFGVNTGAHGPVQPEGEPRVSLSAGVCGSCHGEPLRHGRYQQWQLSAHADYDLAIREGDDGSCSRCHTVNGFLTWLPILLGDEPGDPTEDITVTWTEDEVHPQTCVTCHDPHSNGTTSGEPNDATVRISGNTPPLIAGFTAYAVGRGAMCMTCHNSRRGLHNDGNFDDIAGTSEVTRMPHGSSQTDILMGENAYLVTTGIRGNHSFLTDTCAACHMVETPPPAVLSYNQSGTNHTFYAGTEICANCHTGFEAANIQGGTQDLLDQVQGLIEAGILDEMAAQIALGRTIDLNGTLVTDVADIEDIEFLENRGRQAITVTFTDQTVVNAVGLNNVDVLDAQMIVIGLLYDFADPALVKAGWNWGIISNDGSLGVHNPSHAWGTLAATIEALDPLLALELETPSWVDPAKAGFHLSARGVKARSWR